MADDATIDDATIDDASIDDAATDEATETVTDNGLDDAAAPLVPRGELTITLNGTDVDAHRGELLIAAAERHGVYIPHFCYHPRMEPVGMCRMCIVEVDTGRGPALQPSCMLEATDGMVVDTVSEVTTKAQEGILEFLLINHPLDCPVCDKGGECPLQDQAMAYGPGESRFVESKRHKEKPIPISDLVLLDRERCILCDRCTRFAKDVAGDPLIHFIHRGNNTEVNTFPDEPFASYFSGNTVQICPVGALTAEPYRFKARPWDLVSTESTCQTCSVGCRVAVESSRNEVLRYQGVDIDPVNWGWLCDKGRFAFQAVNATERLTDPLMRTDGELRPVRWAEALRHAATLLRSTVDDHGSGAVGIIGGARLSNEDAYAWAKLAKGVLGTDNVDAQLGDGLPAEVVFGLPAATIDDVCTPGGTVVLVAPDVKEELPVLYLRLRHAATADGVKLIELSPGATGMTPYAAASLQHRPGDAAEVLRTLFGVPAAGADAGGVDDTALAGARTLLDAAEGPVTVVVGRSSLAESEVFTVDAIGVLRQHLPDARFLVALRRGNVRGALDMGLAPGMLPGRVTLAAGSGRLGDLWPAVPTQRGLGTAAMLAAAANGDLRTLVLLGSDPLSDFPDGTLARRALEAVDHIIAVDTVLNTSSARASVVLPAAGFTEVEGTTTNLEGRVSVLNQKVTPPGTARSDWIIAAELAMSMGADLGLESLDAIWDEITVAAPSHGGLSSAHLRSPAAVDGVVVPVVDSPVVAPEPFVPPAPEPLAPGDSYSLRLVSSRKLYDEGVAVQTSPSLASLPPGSVLRINRYDFDRLGVTNGETVQVSSASSSTVAEARCDDTLPRGTVGIWFNQPGLRANDLISVDQSVTVVQVQTTSGAGASQ